MSKGSRICARPPTDTGQSACLPIAHGTVCSRAERCLAAPTSPERSAAAAAEAEGGDPRGGPRGWTRPALLSGPASSERMATVGCHCFVGPLWPWWSVPGGWRLSANPGRQHCQLRGLVPPLVTDCSGQQPRGEWSGTVGTWWTGEQMKSRAGL